jgi:hypothetical protein
MELQAATAFATGGEPVPDWWPYAREFPYWRVWRGVAGLMYARRVKASPPRVVRGKDPVDLRDQIMRAERVRLPVRPSGGAGLRSSPAQAPNVPSPEARLSSSGRWRIGGNSL